MNRRMMTYAAIGAAFALSVPAWAQTAGPGSAQGSAQSNLATYGTASPVVAGAGNGSGSAAGAATGGVGVPAGGAGSVGVQLGVSSSGPTMAGGSGVSAGLTTTTGTGIATPPMAGNTSAQANAGTIGTAALTGTTLPCASTSAAVGVLPIQMPSDCQP
jgi:trimeric autotransporter adhesin